MRIVLFLLGCCGILFSACVSVDSDTVVKVSVDTMEEQTPAYTLHMEIPSFPDYPELSKAISTTAARWQNDFIDMTDILPEVGSAARGELVLTWVPAQLSPKCISILLDGYMYTGGANGMPLLASFTWDISLNRFLSIEDLFSEQENVYAYLSDIAREQLSERLCSPEIDPDNIIQGMIKQGTAAEPENFKIFTVPAFGCVTVYFNKYQVAPGYMGVQSIKLWQ